MPILEFTQDRVKLLEVAKRGQDIRLSRLSKKAIAGLSDIDASKVVSELLREAAVKKKRPLVVAIPRHLFTVRNLSLPSLEDKELRDMAGLQAGKQLPYPADELVWDFKVIKKRPDGYSDGFLVLGHRKVLDRFIDILRNAGLEADRIVLSSEALFGWHLGLGGSGKEEAKGGVCAVVDIDSSYIDVIILKGDILEFSRSFSSKNNLKEMKEELSKTFHSYEKESSNEISSIILTGIEERAAAFKAELEAADDKRSMTAVHVHPLRIASPDYREALPDYFELSRDVSFACVLGIAFNLLSPGSPNKGITMDFLPPDLKDKRDRERRKKALTRTLLLLAGISLVLFGVLLKGIADKRRAFNMIDVKIKETEPKVRNLREISQNIEIIKQNLDTRGSCVDVIREVFKTIPQGLSISVLDFELERSLVLRGVSGDLNSVFGFSSELEKSPYFEDCRIKYAQKRVIKAQELVDFEIDCRLSRRREGAG